MNQRAAPIKAGPIGDTILLLLATIATIFLLGKVTAEDSSTRSYLRRDEPVPLRLWREMDPVILSAAPPEGEFFAILPPVSADDRREPNLVISLYYRAVYLLWPQRLLVADPGTIVLDKLPVTASPPGDAVSTVRFRLDNGALKFDGPSNQRQQVRHGTWAWLAAYLCIIGICGYAATVALARPSRQSLVEFTASVTLLGFGVTSLLLVWFSMIGVRPTRFVLVFLAIIAIATITIAIIRRRLPAIERPGLAFPGLSAVLALPAIALILWIISGALAATLMPAWDIDPIAIWGLKAKVLYNQSLTPRPDYFSDLSLSYSHLDYPLLVPMSWAGAYGAMGVMDDRLGKIVLLAPMCGLVGMLYAQLRRWVGSTRAWVLTALGTALPAFGKFGGLGGADVVLAAFICATAIFLFRWIQNGRRADAIVCGVMASLAAQTKLEGLVLLGSCIVLVTIIACIRRSGGWIAFAVTVCIVFGPWLIWSWNLPRTHENYVSRLTPTSLAAGTERMGELARLVIGHFMQSSWHATTGVLILAAAIGWRAWKNPAVIAAWVILITQLLAYATAYLVTPWNLAQLVDLTIYRLLIHVTPLAMLLAGLHWRSFVSRQEGNPVIS